jgi:hypothetical protein
MARHETFNAFMTAIVAYAPLVGVIAFFTGEQFGIIFSGLFTFGFWASVTAYFLWDYYKTHKKRKAKMAFPSLTIDTEVAKEVIPPKLTKFYKFLNWFFFLLEVFEVFLFLILPPLVWQVFTINGVPVVTYQNGFWAMLFAFGLFLAVDVTRRIRNPKKIMEFFIPD